MNWSKPIDVSDASDRCPRCSGNLSKEYDALGGWDAACLQCGFRGPPPRPRPARRAGPAEPAARDKTAHGRKAARKRPTHARAAKARSTSRARGRRS